MGTYMHLLAETRRNGRWEMNRRPVFPPPPKQANGEPWATAPFGWQSYRLFGFLAGVRNESGTVELARKRGLPEDISKDALLVIAPRSHCDGAFMVDPAQDDEPEIDLYDFENRMRLGKTVKDVLIASPEDRGSHTWLTADELFGFDYEQQLIDRREAPPLITTYRELLSPEFFKHLGAMKSLGPPQDTRLLICFS
jgi:hypothetical protein